MDNKFHTKLSVWLPRWTQQGLSQASLARKLGIDPSVVAHWLSGRKLPDPKAAYWPALLNLLKLNQAEVREAYELVGIPLSPLDNAARAEAA